MSDSAAGDKRRLWPVRLSLSRRRPCGAPCVCACVCVYSNVYPARGSRRGNSVRRYRGSVWLSGCYQLVSIPLRRRTFLVRNSESMAAARIGERVVGRGDSSSAQRLASAARPMNRSAGAPHVASLSNDSSAGVCRGSPTTRMARYRRQTGTNWLRLRCRVLRTPECHPSARSSA